MTTIVERSMKDLGLLQIDVATICGVTPRTVQNWLKGRVPVPQPVTLLMKALLEERIDLIWVAKRLPKAE